VKNTDAWDDNSNLMQNDTKQAAESNLSIAGRDHNPGTMAGWMVGAGITGGQVFDARDAGDYKTQEQPISAHDRHSTMLPDGDESQEADLLLQRPGHWTAS
jgi:hypothetical protein